jgi:hypothetical protein
MKTDLLSVIEAACLAGAVALVGCSSSSSGASSGAAGCPAVDAGCPGKEAGCPATDAGCPAKEAGCPAATPGNAQTPPTGTDADIVAWLTKGDYKAWTCEPTPHPARLPSVHTVMNRICSNTLVSQHGTGEYPVGSANVKEIYDTAGTTIVGYALYRKMAAGGADSWYLYEKTKNDGIVANGLGTGGAPKTICVGCHNGAGSDANHSGHDFVYTQVK